MSKRAAAIPPAEWKWFGRPMHFICARRCQFRLATQVGKFIISTVGDFRPKPDAPMEEIGCDRFYETFVFRAGAPGDCGCPKLLDASEIDSEAYGKEALCAEVCAGHMKMCRRWARRQNYKEPKDE